MFYNPMQKTSALSANVSSAFGPRSMRSSKQGNINKQIALDTARGVGKTIGKTALGVGKSILSSPIRVASSLAEAPRVYRGKEPFKPFNVPGLGQVKTYSREAADRINAGDGSNLNTLATILGVGGQAILDTAALGGAANQIFNPSGRTTALARGVRKISPNLGSKIDQLTYRPFGPGSPQGWQLRASKALNLPFWNPTNL